MAGGGQTRIRLAAPGRAAQEHTLSALLRTVSDLPSRSLQGRLWEAERPSPEDQHSAEREARQTVPRDTSPPGTPVAGRGAQVPKHNPV